MLVLTRKNHEVIQIGDGITLTVLGNNGNTVRLGIDAPPEVEVLREELFRRRQLEATNRLLIVEDCPEDRVAYRRFLSDPAAPWVFSEADSGEEGLALCAAQRPDCVLLDYLLPDLDGIEFLDRLRRQQDRRDIPVIMVTGNASDDLVSQALRSGAKGFLRKTDLSRDLLQQAVREALRGARVN